MITLLFSFTFSVPAQAVVNTKVLQRYIYLAGGGAFRDEVTCLGSWSYWEKQIEEGLWTGENRRNR